MRSIRISRRRSASSITSSVAGRERPRRRHRAVAIPKIRRWRGRRTASGSRFTRIARCRTMCGCGPAGRQAQPDKRITFLGRGAEVGWPRWSPDGKLVLLDGARKSDGRSVIYVIGVDQDSGAITSELREVKAEGVDGEMRHAEWLGGSSTVVGVAKEGPGRHVIFTSAVAGGQADDRASLRDRARLLRPRRLGRWQVGGVCRAGDRRLLPDLQEGRSAATRRRCRSRPILRTRRSRRGRPMARASRSPCGATTRRSGRSSAR